MPERVERCGDSVVIYDEALVHRMDEGVFERRSQGDEVESSRRLAGRGETFVITIEGRSCVCRHYYRGGAIRRVAENSFIWTGQSRTRPFVEWRLLASLRRRDLPVPRPVAARYVRHGLVYTADLITEQLIEVESLATRLTAGPASGEMWRGIGSMIARFHAERVFHADLNAHNIQAGDDGSLYLLDFDRGRIMPDVGDWTQRNLRRLQRSLQKISRLDGASFSTGDWAALMDGYRAEAGA